MNRSMIAAAVCSLMVGCGGAPGDDKPSQGDAAPDTQSDLKQGAADNEAGTVSAMSSYNSEYGGAASVTFYPAGDKFLVQDTKPDGHSAVLEVAGYSDYWNSDGSGTSKTFVINFKERVNINFRVCLGDHEKDGSRKVGPCAAWTKANSAY